MKSVIITGATRGIGLALARFYADKGYCLMLNGGHNEEALDAVEKELSTKTQVITCLGSVAEEKTAATIVQKTLDTFGQIDLLINNAGIAHIGLLSDMSSEEWHTLMGTNLDSVFYMSKAVIPHMVHCHSGKILNVSSVWGEVGLPAKLLILPQKVPSILLQRLWLKNWPLHIFPLTELVLV